MLIDPGTDVVAMDLMTSFPWFSCYIEFRDEGLLYIVPVNITAAQ